MSTSAGTQKVVQRQAWSESECQEIRDYAEANPKSTCCTIKRWFEGTHPNKEITQSQTSRILNPKRPRGPSDAPIIQKVLPTTKRLRTGKFPELDAALFEWQQIMQKRKIAITGLLVQDRALQF